MKMIKNSLNKSFTGHVRAQRNDGTNYEFN